MTQRHTSSSALLTNAKGELKFARLTSGVASYRWPVPDRVKFTDSKVYPLYTGVNQSIKAYYPAETGALVPALTKLAEASKGDEKQRLSALQSFITNFGLLRTPPWNPVKAGDIEDHFSFAIEVRRIVGLVEKREMNEVAERINRIRQIPNCAVQHHTMVDPGSNRLVPLLFSSDLRGLITVQLEEYASNGELHTCEWCGQLFRPVRSDQKYCPPILTDYLHGLKPQTRSRCKQAAKSKRWRDEERKKREQRELERTLERYGSTEE